MQDAGAVRRIEPVENLDAPAHDRRNRRVPPPGHAVLQRLVAGQLHHDRRKAIDLPDPEHEHTARIGDARGQARLAVESRQPFG